MIASSEDVNVHCPTNGKFSFFNSPYPAHRSYEAIDIYPKKKFSEIALSPVRGKVIKFKKVRCRRGRGFNSSKFDFIILLRSLENRKRWIKILHLKPIVDIGDVIELGDDLGTLLQSGFFNFWTEPHLHIEVRKPSDPIRARGGFRFKIVLNNNAVKHLRELSGKVVDSNIQYSLIKLDEPVELGIPVQIGSKVALLDAGLPHYEFFGIYTDKVNIGNDDVMLCNKKIGTVISSYSNMCIAKCSSLFYLKGKKIGLSLYLHLHSNPLVKIIPKKINTLHLNKNEKVHIKIS